MPGNAKSHPFKGRQSFASCTAEKENLSEANMIDDPNKDALIRNAQKAKPSKDKKSALDIFRLAAASTSQATFWKQQPQLAASVVEASLVMPEKAANGMLLLEEHSTELLNVCRKLIKDSTETTREPVDRLDALHVGVHGLRAICPILAGQRSKSLTALSAVVKLLYHAIATADSVYKIAAKKEKSYKRATKQKAAWYALAAFETLGQVLQQYTVKASLTKLEITPLGQVSFVLPKFTTDNGLIKNNSIRGIFPIPLRTENGGRESGSLSEEQVTTIGIQSIMAVSNILSKLCRLKEEGEIFIRDNYAFGKWTKRLLDLTTSEGNGDAVSPQELLVHIIGNVAQRWIVFLASSSGAEESKILKEVCSHCKQAHRILWETAAIQTESKHESGKCLSLRCVAIRALLLGYSDCQLPLATHKIIQEKHFENACKYAWNAAVAYVQQTSTSCPIKKDPNDPLQRFYCMIGPLLYSFSKNGNNIAYVEYCAYQALHTGALYCSVCKQKDCPFRKLPFGCPIKNCTHDGSSNSDDMATLELFLLSLYIRERLSVQREISVLDTVDDSFVRYAMEIIDRFGTLVANAKSCTVNTRTNRVRYYKVLSTLSLPRVVYRSIEAKENPLAGSEDCKHLSLASDILWRCMGRFILTLVHDNDMIIDDKKLPMMWDVLVECFLRSSSVCERLSSFSRNTKLESAEHISRADLIIGELVQSLFKWGKTNTLLQATYERVAKVSLFSYSLLLWDVTICFLHTLAFSIWPTSER